MATSQKDRITVTLSKDNNIKLQTYASQMGMTKSSLCAFFIQSSLWQLDKVAGVIEQTPEVLSGQLSLADVFATMGAEAKEKAL